MRDADGLLGASVRLNKATLAPATRLKIVSTISVGYDTFDVDDLTERGILLAHTPGVLTETTADTIFALILATARRVVELAEFIKAGRWRLVSTSRSTGWMSIPRRSDFSAWVASVRRSRAVPDSVSI